MRYLLVLIILIHAPVQLLAKASVCFGTTSNGYLENGIKLPPKGKNFVAYSTIGRIAGRTYVHSTVKQIIVNAYKKLEKEQPKKIFQYGETGYKNGGQIKPHKTHRNGLSVDFMVPVVDEKGRSVHLPTHLFNRFGYNIDFNKKGKYKNLKIDYEAMAAHIMVLHKEAVAAGYKLWRVIFDPDLQPELYKTSYASYLKKNIKFSKNRSWIRHDQHYHVDFQIPCQSLK